MEKGKPRFKPDSHGTIVGSTLRWSIYIDTRYNIFQISPTILQWEFSNELEFEI